MKPFIKNSGFCSFETLMMVVILGILPSVLIVARSGARRMSCQAKEKEITLAMNAYHSMFKRFPPSCHTRKEKAAANHDGYSFLVDCLPFIEEESLWKRLNIAAPLNEENDSLEYNAAKPINVPNEALAMSLPVFRCPNSQTGLYADETNQQAITNYKATCASTRTAYEVSSREDVDAEGLDIYGTGLKKTSSDGAIFVGSRTSVASISDGVTNTFLLTETEEQTYSRWIVGQECGLYTMTDDTAFQAADPAKGLSYISPAGYTANRYGSESTIPKEKRKTNLTRDYEANPYPWGEAGFRSARYTGDGKTEGVKLGPGSAHDKIVNHAYVGGAVSSISKKIDMAAYFFTTTRANGDPAPDLDSID